MTVVTSFGWSRAVRAGLYLSMVLVAACGDSDSAGDSGARTDSGANGRDGSLNPGNDGGLPPLDSCADAQPLPALATEEVVPGARFRQPVLVTSAPGDPDTLYVLEKFGTIRLVRDGAVVDGDFLDISARTRNEGEQGLLGLAFHPDYASNGRFFVFYTSRDPRRNVVEEYTRSSDNPDVADDAAVTPPLVNQRDTESNHNAGMLAFGPDGFLYVAMGDEGGRNDEHGNPGNGLNRDTLFGNILRLDVDNVDGDFAAAGNPFSGSDGLPQIWHYGLRNPWRFSFDRLTGDMYIGDVGQGAFEEISFQPAGDNGGLNFGWRAYEANSVFRRNELPLATNHTPPILAIPHDDDSFPIRAAEAVIGGYVYRGQNIPGLTGTYLYGNSVGSPELPQDIAALRYVDGELCDNQRLPDLNPEDGVFALGSFGEDANGELYLAYVGSGHVLRIIPAP